MPDVFDHASGVEALFTEMALAEQLATSQKARSTRESATECEDCGDEIPQERRQHVPGCRFCTACQAKRE